MPAGKKTAAAGISDAAPARKTAKGYKRPVELPFGTEINSGGASSSSNKQSWIVGQLVGHGGFGDVYVTDTSRVKLSMTKSQYVVKIEPKDNGPLFVETKFFKAVAGEKQINEFRRQNKLDHVGVPIYYDSGVFDYKTAALRYLVIQRLGNGLDAEMRKVYGAGKRNRLPVPLLFELAVQLIDALHYIHSHGFTHGDIKENNIMLGWPKSDSAYLIDFGLTNRFILEGKHREYRENPKAAHDGTLEFTSMDSHKGVSGSRRSDMQILGFCLTKLLYGQLPWSGVEQPPVVMEQKAKYLAKPDSLLRDSAGRNSGDVECKALENFWKQVSKLGYDEEPNYDKLRSLFLPRSSHGLFNVARNLVELTTASSSSKRRSESPPAQKEQPKAARKPAVRARPPSAASSTSSKRSKSTSSAKSDDTDDDSDTPKVLKRSPVEQSKSPKSTISARATRAAKRLKLNSISESSEAGEIQEADEMPVAKSRGSKQSTRIKPSEINERARPAVRHRANSAKDSSDNDDQNDTDGVFDAEADAGGDIEIVGSTRPSTKKTSALSASRRTRKPSVESSGAETRRGKPVLLLPLNVTPKKKNLQYFDAEVYAIPPVPKARATSLQPPTSTAPKRGGADADDAKNPFRLSKFTSSGGSSSQQQQTNDSDTEEKNANSSFSQPASSNANTAVHNNGPRAVHKKLMHFDQEVTIIAENDTDDDGFGAPAGTTKTSSKTGRSKRI